MRTTSSTTIPTFCLHLLTCLVLNHSLRLPWYMVLMALSAVPRVLGLLLGRWLIVGRSSLSSLPPVGRWNLYGNPFPESGIALESTGQYPTRPGIVLSGRVIYYQSPTLAGLLMAPIHVYGMKIFRAVTTEERVGTGDNEYLMPTIHEPSRGWQSNVFLQPTPDPGVWRRSYHTNPQRVSYIWVHESIAPTEDWISFPPGAYGMSAAIYAAAVACALIVWSRGTFILVMLVEALIKRGVYSCMHRLV